MIMKTKLIDGKERVYAPCDYKNFCPGDTIDNMVSSLGLEEWNGVRVFSFEHRIFVVDADKHVSQVYGQPVDDIAMMMFRTSMHTFLEDDPRWGMDGFIKDADDHSCSPLFAINGIIYYADWQCDNNIITLHCIYKPDGADIPDAQRTIIDYMQEGDDETKKCDYGIVGTYTTEVNGDIVCEFWHWNSDN